MFAGSAALGFAAPATAQLSASLTATSDYRVRGQSFSLGHPALTAALGYDHRSGVYAGGSATGGTTAHDGSQLLGHSEFIGYAATLTPATGWEAGASNTQIFVYADRRYAVDYVELYAGLNGRRVSAHVFYSPNYLGSAAATMYFDLAGTLHPAEHWRVFGHAGMLTPLRSPRYGAVRQPQIDLRAGVAVELGRTELQASWAHAGSRYDYLTGGPAHRDALIVAASWFF